MASKEVLITAIKKLKDTNCRIYEKCCKTSDEKLKTKLRGDIAKNESMILDYQYRLEHE